MSAGEPLERGFFMNFDLEILEFIQNYLRNDVFDAIMPLITKLGDRGMIWIISSVLLLLFPGTRKAGAAVAASLILEALCCNVILKPFAARPRPFQVNTEVQLLIPPLLDYSFPSGHTGAAFAAASALFFMKSRLWIPALILSVLMGFTRLYLYVHYPSDVLAGALLGILSGWIGNRLIRGLGGRRGHSPRED